jgi:hypothetical protein
MKSRLSERLNMSNYGTDYIRLMRYYNQMETSISDKKVRVYRFKSVEDRKVFKELINRLFNENGGTESRGSKLIPIIRNEFKIGSFTCDIIETLCIEKTSKDVPFGYADIRINPMELTGEELKSRYKSRVMFSEAGIAPLLRASNLRSYLSNKVK